MAVALVLILVLPLGATVASLTQRPQVAHWISALSGGVTFLLSLGLIPALVRSGAVTAGFLRVDALSEVFLMATSFLYFISAVYTVGYLRSDPHALDSRRFATRLLAGINVFGWTMLWVPLVNDIALLWISIEVTTVVSALLVMLEDTEAAIEAAWKYLLIASAGLGIALFATVLAYSAGTTTLGSSYAPHLDTLIRAAPGFPRGIIELTFALAVLGFGTKMGLFPVHTWLPDAHSEAPTPVSALLSGSLLGVSFYAILRYFQIASATLGNDFPRRVLLVFGIASLLLAALFLIEQRNLKRLLAYSSIEHMGILALATGFGAPLALVGMLLHVLAHAAAKAAAFFGAGSLVIKCGTKDMTRIRGGINLLPYSGFMLLLSVLALSAAPPFGIFRSEFLIVSGGLSTGDYVPAALLVVLITVAFFGMAFYATRTLLSPAPQGLATSGAASQPRGEISAWIVCAMVLGLVALLVLGVHPPGGLEALLNKAAAQLMGKAS